MSRPTLLRCLAVAAAVAAVAHAGTPDQWKSRTIYQILTDRFANPSSSGGCGDLSDYCGGTWNGIADHLEYITAMGFDALWISPVVENTDNGYHGYWAKDLFSVNSHFGTPDDLKSLVDACHAKGVWVMLDVVGNHMGYGDISAFNPFNSTEHYHDCTGCDNNCNINNFQDQPMVQHCRLSGLPDLNQSSPFVAQQLTSWVKGIIAEYGFDGLRVDTTPEVNMPFWQSFQASAGVYAVGEVDNGNPAYVGPYQGGALDATLSYPMFYTLRHVFAQKQSMKGISQQLANYQQYFSDPSLLGTFVDNHDNPRFLSVTEDTVAYRSALMWTLFSNGIPIVYYGTEQGFHGGNDPANREVLWPSGFNTNAPLYTFLKQVVAFRKQTQPWLQPQVEKWSDDNFYAFTRGTTLVVLTNVGNGGAQQVRTIPNLPYSDGTKLCNMFYPATDCLTVTGKSAKIYLDGGESKVYIPQ